MAKLPYENATSGERAMQDIQKTLRSFGCTKFATGHDFETGELFVQFEYRGRMVHLTASSHGYAQKWIENNPWSSRKSLDRAGWESKALEIGGVAVYSILRDWVKGQITAIETGVVSFDQAFFANIKLPNGKTMLEHAVAHDLLPAPEETP